MDYPGDWSAVDETDHVTFTSSTGLKIELKPTQANPGNSDLKVGNRYCSSRTNQNHLTAEICADNASFIYTATFSLEPANSPEQFITLSTQARAAGDVFEQMFDTIRLIK